MSTTGTLILAAGRSSRMGRPKALLPYRGRTILEHQVTLYSVFGPVWVAVNAELALEVQLLAIPAPVFVMENPAPGLFSTVKPCLARLRCRVDRIFVTPVDCLLPDGTVPAALLEADKGTVPALVPTYDQQPGHPVLLRCPGVVHVAEQPVESRFDHVLAQLNPGTVPVDEPRILLNLNTLDDYNRLLEADAAGRRMP